MSVEEEDAPVDDMSTSRWTLVYPAAGPGFSHLAGMHSRYRGRGVRRAVAFLSLGPRAVRETEGYEQ